ncbi:IS30 family transposase [Patescibacteria group bacterium]
MKKKKKQRRSFRHLNQFDRDRIEALDKAGFNQKEIAEVLKVSPSRISREMKRKRKDGRYDARNAQLKADVKRRNSKYQGMKIEKYPELRNRIIKGLKKFRSPDEIAGRMEKENIKPRVKANAIYKWLYSSYGQEFCKYLCTKRYRIKKQTGKSKREMIPDKKPLELRPSKGEHAEGDLFVSPTKSGSKRSGSIFCIPSAQLLLGRMIPSKKPVHMVRVVNEVSIDVCFDDLTLDNGIENRYHKQFNVDTYFADPYAPWQKAHVENNIGLLRKWFISKGTNLKNVSEKDYQKYLHVLNGKYRKSLGYKSAYEVALERGIIKKIPTFDSDFS